MTTKAVDSVAILGIRFPRLFVEEAVALLLSKLRAASSGGPSTGVCFPDMSTLNLAVEKPQFRRLLQRRMIVLADGAGVMWVASCRGQPLPANLNGTDLVPRLLLAAPAGTTVFLLGGRDGVAEKTSERFTTRFAHLRFVGSSHGYLDAEGEGQLVERLRVLRPQVILVGMGNPQQVELIDRHLDDPSLRGTLWLAVGGQFDYYGGALRRAPQLLRRLRLEWLYIVMQQPHKLRRYFIGIPLYLGRCALAALTGSHDIPDGESA